jgi:uncharacterized membrane protein
MTASQTFALTLYPHRSLGKVGHRWVIGSVAVICGVNALRFWLVQAWPVALFLLIDIMLVWWAFRASRTSGRRYEELRITGGNFVVRQVSPYGTAREHVFSAHWVQVLLEPVNQMQNRLLLVHRDQQLEIGTFLAPFERADVKAEIERGLRAAKV